MSGHAAVERLSAWLDGELEAGERRGVESHLETCPDCRSRLAGLERVAARLESLRRLPPPAVLDAWAERALPVARPAIGSRRRIGLVERPDRAAQPLIVPFALILASVLLLSLHGVTRDAGVAPLRLRVIAVPGAVLDGPAARVDDRFLVLVDGLWRDAENVEIPLAAGRPASADERAALLAELPGLADLLAEGDVELARGGARLRLSRTGGAPRNEP